MRLSISGTAYDHKVNGVEISPDENYLYFNSGSRTDHGEVQDKNGIFPDTREVPLTSAIFRIPIDSENLLLPNNVTELVNNGYLYADGVRNSYDIAFASNGDMFAIDNAGDRDDTDELNWIKQGNHYGFPWRIGTNDNPQQFPGYDPDLDLLVNKTCCGYTAGIFYNDPAFPGQPTGITFTEPILNTGVDADKYRDPNDGSIGDASDNGVAIGTFTPHRSPLGLVFDNENALGNEYTGDVFLLSFTQPTSSLLMPFNDASEDLLHLTLTKNIPEDRYELTSEKIVSGFSMPIDAVLIDNKLFVLEYGGKQIWKVTFPAINTCKDETPPTAILNNITGNEINVSLLDQGCPTSNISSVLVKTLENASLSVNDLVVNVTDNNPYYPSAFSSTLNIKINVANNDARVVLVIFDGDGNKRTWFYDHN